MLSFFFASFSSSPVIFVFASSERALLWPLLGITVWRQKSPLANNPVICSSVGFKVKKESNLTLCYLYYHYPVFIIVISHELGQNKYSIKKLREFITLDI